MNPLVEWERQVAVMSLLGIGARMPNARVRMPTEHYASLLRAAGQRSKSDTDEALIERAMAVGVYWANAQIMAALVFADRCGLATAPAKACALAFAESPSASTAAEFAASATYLASDWTNDLVVYLHGAGGAATNLAAALDTSRSTLLRVSSLRDVLAGVDDFAMILPHDWPDRRELRERAVRLVIDDLARAIRGAQ